MHLRAVSDCIGPYTAENYNYLKSSFTSMSKRSVDYPRVLRTLKTGFHFVDRSSQLWAGITTLKGSLLNTGGIQSGSGMSEKGESHLDGIKARS